MSSKPNERVDELKREFEEYVKAYNPHENNIDRIFRDWAFEKIADLQAQTPMSLAVNRLTRDSR